MYTLTGHQKGVRAMVINENYLVTAGFDQTVLVWNWVTGRKVASFRAHNEVVCLKQTFGDITKREIFSTPHYILMAPLYPSAYRSLVCT